MQNELNSQKQDTEVRMQLAKREHDHQIELLSLKIEQVRQDLRAGTDDRWRKSDMEKYAQAAAEWVTLFGALNPGMVIPPFEPSFSR